MPRKPFRQNEILSLLARYGVLTTNNLTELLDSRISHSFLRSILYDLENNNLLRRLRFKSGHCWAISSNTESILEVLKRTNTPKNLLRTKNLHWSAFPHESSCTTIQASLERSLPEVETFREGTLKFKELPSHLMSERVKQNGYTPDLVLKVAVENKNDSSAQSVFRYIAVEVDRTQRSKRRISQRANIYSRHTSFSGLLYFVPNIKNVASFQQIYKSRGAMDSIRLRGGEKSFLATTAIADSLFDAKDLIVNTLQGEQSLCDWVALIARFETHKRDAAVQMNQSSAQGFV